MHNVASIGILIGTLAVATLPARADDQAIGFATGQLGGPARPAQTDNQQARVAFRQHGTVQRAAPLPQVSSEAYAGFAQGGGLVQACSHVGGPKGNWTCR
jgi:Tfp pilus assembly protein FimV